jgi:murein DD-endopeptidase MepM/ murein hydrolase activator NlpD
MLLRRVIFFLAISVLVGACTSGPNGQPVSYPTYDPFVPLDGSNPSVNYSDVAGSEATRTPGPTPSLAPLTVHVATRKPDAPISSPTPDTPRMLPTPRQAAVEYVVQSGDTLGSIAEAYGISPELVAQANEIALQSVLNIGQSLLIPAPSLDSAGPAFKIIPDSELVYGPASADFDIAAFIQASGGYLASYQEEVSGDILDGAQVVQRIAEDYSVNPRLLLAVLEYRSKWVSRAEPAPGTADFPLGFVQPNRGGLYHQLAWAATELNRGFYLWRANAVGNWVLGDGSVVPINPSINAGTAGVQSLFSILDDQQTWQTDVAPYGLFQAYFFMFGSPFDLAVEPLVPAHLAQPRMSWPFAHGAQWAFTGGPHPSWDYGSAWGAIDFAPSDVEGCAVSQEWVTAAADGYIVRAANGAVMQDLDGDGYEQTGWDILYMHMAAEGRIQAGTYAYAGDRIGHPSCEGGIANAAHLHLTRKYNGEWLPADGTLPFVLSGWASSGNGVEYDGFFKRGSKLLEAAEGITDNNQISP